MIDLFNDVSESDSYEILDLLAGRGIAVTEPQQGADIRYLPVPVMDTLVVLLTVPEDELVPSLTISSDSINRFPPPET